MRNICTIEGCGGVRVGWGLCSKHWQRDYYKKHTEQRRALARGAYKKHRDKILPKLRVIRAKKSVEERNETNLRASDARLRKWFQIPSVYQGGPEGYAGIAEYDRRLAGQGGGCALCGKASDDGRRLGVDHNHRTGRVRGLLCSFCNGRILGRLERARNRISLPKLLEYLKQYDPGNELLRGLKEGC